MPEHEFTALQNYCDRELADYFRVPLEQSARDARSSRRQIHRLAWTRKSNRNGNSPDARALGAGGKCRGRRGDLLVVRPVAVACRGVEARCLADDAPWSAEGADAVMIEDEALRRAPGAGWFRAAV